MSQARDAIPNIDFESERTEKFRQLCGVLEGCFDLLNDAITGDEWLGSLAKLANCDAAACLWWREHRPGTLRADVYGIMQDSADDWARALEPLVDTQRPKTPTLIDPDPTTAPIFNDEHMVYCLTAEPVRIVFIFARRRDGKRWQALDQENALKILHILQKPVTTRIKLSWYVDITDLSNKVFDAVPRGIICVTPDGEIMRINALARRLLDKGNVLFEQNGKIMLRSAEKNEEFYAQLRGTLLLSSDEITHYSWHRNLTGNYGPDDVMVALRAYPFDNWKLESSARDRVVVMAIQTRNGIAPPPVAQVEEFFGLTPAQARVAVALTQSSNIKDVATELCISVNTLRSHLRAIYAHLGIANKGELTALIASTITEPDHSA